MSELNSAALKAAVDKMKHSLETRSPDTDWEDALEVACGAAIGAYLAALPKQDADVTLGVGDGSGNLFVHGDYDSIKVCQALIFRMEKAEQRVRELELPKQEPSGATHTANCEQPCQTYLVGECWLGENADDLPDPPKGAEG